MESATDTAGVTDKSSQVQIRLSTRNPDIEIPSNPGLILVNTNFRRLALSTLVNTLRKSEKPIPFEFLINGSFLRTSLDKYLTANGISSETPLLIEYVRALSPPSYLVSFEHPDWVSSVDVLSNSSLSGHISGESESILAGQERILSGSYDGQVRIWNTSSEVLATSPALDICAPVSATKFIDASLIASAGHDRVLHIWKYSAASPSTASASLQPKLDLYGHRGGIGSVSTHAASNRILTGSIDHTIGFWSTKKVDAPEAPSSLISGSTSSAKRRKVGPAISTAQRGPLSIMKSHDAPVSGVTFNPMDHTVAYSSSLDHSLKTWDLPTSKCVDTRAASASLMSIGVLPSLNLVAAGVSPRNIILVDPRATAATVAAMTLQGHRNMVSSLAADPNNSYSLVSGSHDGTCRIWDVRSARSETDGRVGRSTFVIERESAKGRYPVEAGEGVKVFDVCWDHDVGIVSASEDKKVQINKGESLSETEKR